MFGFIKKVFGFATSFLACNVFKVNQLKCVLINNQECKIRPQIKNIKSTGLSFYPYSVKINKCVGSCNNANDPYV